MYQTDFHLHTSHSFDSKTNMAVVCQYALDKKYMEICFTEHYSLIPGVPTYGHLDWDLYNADIQENRNSFRGRLNIRKGIELCEPHQRVADYQHILENQEIDLILGSIHNVYGRKLRFLLRDFGKEIGYSAFFDETLAMVQSADIDCVAHLDIIKRYGGEAFSDQDLNQHLKIISRILQTMIDRRIALEINTSTCKKLGQTSPAENILMLYKDLGGSLITFGSDSHTGTSLGDGIDAAKQTALKCGFTTYCTFERRTATQRDIEV